MQTERSVKTNALLNIIKQCCNILLPLITYPYISRVVGAASLGRFSFADSIVQYAIILATLGAPAYAIREGARIRDNKKEITALSAKIFTINIISMLVSLFVLT
jgi:O-antigen/teichoic acid export membrane protein